MKTAIHHLLMCLALLEAARGVRLQAGDVMPRRASDFIQSVGVAAHFNWSSAPDATHFEKLKAYLLEARILHVRIDNVAPGMNAQDRAAVLARCRQLGQANIRLTISILARSEQDVFQPEEGVRAILDDIRATLGPYVEALGGTNEPDIFRPWTNTAVVDDWVTHVFKWQQAIYRQAKRDPVFASIPILGPPAGRLGYADFRAKWASIKQWEDVMDFADAHFYYREAPEQRIPRLLEQMAEVNPRMVAARKVIATETGYHSVSEGRSKDEYVNERSIAIYLPRLLVESFRIGIPRSHIYMLIDTRPFDPADKQATVGLIRYDGTPKPSYLAIRNMNAVIADSGTGQAKLKPLGFEFTERPEGMESLLLGKSDGSYVLALWRRTAATWDPKTKSDLYPEAGAAKVRFSRAPGKVSVYVPTRSAEPDKTVAASEVAVDLAGELVLLKIEPKGI